MNGVGKKLARGLIDYFVSRYKGSPSMAICFCIDIPNTTRYSLSIEYLCIDFMNKIKDQHAIA